MNRRRQSPPSLTQPPPVALRPRRPGVSTGTWRPAPLLDRAFAGRPRPRRRQQRRRRRWRRRRPQRLHGRRRGVHELSSTPACRPQSPPPRGGTAPAAAAPPPLLRRAAPRPAAVKGLAAPPAAAPDRPPAKVAWARSGHRRGGCALPPALRPPCRHGTRTSTARQRAPAWALSAVTATDGPTAAAASPVCHRLRRRRFSSAGAPPPPNPLRNHPRRPAHQLHTHRRGCRPGVVPPDTARPDDWQ
ncbi:hypothetical protein BU14_0126s0023 [Porphyra umbilicalis]|uniref:Uncharacterized protein n=1 Tax=Porphyra umbilicalis TaxID=2786 RepID=A0A1X6PBF0_PORUM|nr:hypothetical protein BU14_0126s0023 [Porphyra umbilicalis]|eukprot:OSX77983.1 hypothetical protein BU14_0126s0023 [Porphyra umbilicalis]